MGKQKFVVACYGTLKEKDFKDAQIVKLDDCGRVRLIPVNSYAEAYQHFDERTIGIAVKNAKIVRR